MKRKDTLTQLKTKSDGDLKKLITDYSDSLWSLKSDLKSGKVKNVREIRVLKRDIARIKTILNKRKYGN